MSEDVTPYGAQPGDENAALINEVRALAAALAWSQREVARRLGFDDRDVRYWLAGKTPVPLGFVLAMRYLAEHPELATATGYFGEHRVADSPGRDK